MSHRLQDCFFTNQEVSMKIRNMKLALAVAIGAVTVFAVPEHASASITAGMSAIISNCLSQSEGLVIARDRKSVV